MRQPYSDNPRSHTGFWITIVGLSVVFVLLAGFGVGGCAVPVMILVGCFAAIEGVYWYFALSRSTPQSQIFADEMLWLFGDHWPETAGKQEFALAHERIWAQRTNRMRFHVHLAVYSIIVGIVIGLLFTPPNNGSVDGVIFSLVWLVILIVHGSWAFPTRGRLERRERAFGQAVLAEIQASVPEFEKRKRGGHYRIGEDGELESVDYPFTLSEDEKPKRVDRA